MTVGMITHPSNPVTNISSADLTKIYTGEITNWSQIGGNDAPIIVVSREDGSGTRSAVEELLKFEDKLNQMLPSKKVMETYSPHR